MGLIVTEHVLASEWAKANCPLNITSLYDPSHLLGLAELAETIHAFGAHTFVQMNPGLGAQGNSILSGDPPVGPSSVSYQVDADSVPANIPFDMYMSGETPREMTIDEIEREQNSFVRAAMFARAAGFDGLEIHSAHGFLLHDFLSPRFNRRSDQYGGSLENRCRFLVELIRKVRSWVGREMVLGIRISAHEPDGTTYQDTRDILHHLSKEEIDYFHLGDGTFEALNWLLPDRDGTMLELEKNTTFKSGLGIPVITPSIHDPKTAEAAISSGLTDMVSLARPLLADPEWPNKVKSGRIREIRKCTRCNTGCFGRVFQGLQVRCEVNPETGLERYNPEYTRWALLKN